MPAPLVPDHELLRLIGRGSYGEVWLARNVMGAWRAVKVVRRDTFDSERPFEREFSGIQRYEPISRSVEGVVPILQVGRIPEGFYYVMELADDASGIAPGNSALAVDTYAPRTLRSDLKRLGRLPVAECLELGLALAAGLAHLHRHGLVHRDLKPSNLIFVNGRARLADLGLVGAIDEVRSFVGTPGYIPPEGPGSPAADVFGLGRVLYEAVTGLSPEDFPNPPADWLTGEISHGALELHEVILRACEPDPLRRHRSASELQADLTLLQSGQSVRRARTLERRVKTLRRVGQAAGLAVLLLAGLGLFAVARARSEREAAVRAESLRKRAEQAEKSARLELSNAQLAQAGLLRRSGLVGQRTRALELIGRAAQTSDRLADLRTEAIAARALPDFTEIKKTRLLAGPPGFWCAVDQTLSRYTRAHPDGSVRIHSWDDDREMATLEGAMAAGLAVWPFSASGALAGGRGGDQAYVWDTRTGKRIFSRTIPGLVGLSITPDDTAVALRVRDGELILVRLADGAEDTRIAPGFSDGGFALSPDGRSFAFFSPSRCEAVLFDKTGKLRDTVRLPPPACPIGLLWTPDSQGLLLAGDDFRSYYAKIDQPEFRAVRLEGHQAEIVGGAAHADQGHALTTSWDETTRLWSLATGRQLLRMNGRGLEFRWAAERLGWLEAGEPGTFRLREFEAFMPSGVRVLPGPTPPRALASNKGAWDVAFVAEGQALAVASYDGVRFWPIGGGAPRLLALGWSRWIEPDPSGTALWVSTATQILRVPLHWDAVKRELWIGEPAPAGLRGRELPLALTGAGSTLLSASGTELLRAASNVVESLGEMPDFTTRLRASPDGRWLLAGDRFSTEMHLLSATNGSSIRQLRVSQNSYGVFLAGSEDLLLITPDGVRRERREDGEVRWVVPRMGVGGGGPVAVAPDGRTLALAPGGREVSLINGETGEVWCRLDPPESGGPVSMRFSPDGSYLAVATSSHTALLWDLAEVRAGLRELNLDWPAPPLAARARLEPVTFTVSAGPLSKQMLLPPGPVDFAAFATHTVANFYSGSPDNRLSGMLPGKLKIGGVEFELRGVIQLGGNAEPNLARRVAGIPVRRQLKRLHFLHASAWPGESRGEIGRYILRFADGAAANIPLIHGENIRDWWIDPKNPPSPPPAWSGSNPYAEANGYGVGLFHLAWDNPRPDQVVESITLETDGRTRLPFLVGLTAE